MKELINSVKGIRLEDFLQMHAPKLRHSRAFYVVAPNMEKKSIYKIGVAGVNTGNSFHRLNEYVILYGKHDTTNSCRGVVIHYCGITEYNRLVLAEKSQVFQLELKLKQPLNATESIAVGRGSERVLSTKVPIKSILKKTKELLSTTKETPIEITRVAREKTKKYRDDTRAFIDSKPDLISSRTRSKVSNKKQ